MFLTSSPRRQSATATSLQPIDYEVLQRYPELSIVLRHYNPANVAILVDNLHLCWRKTPVPTLATLRKLFGLDNIADLIVAHLGAALDRMGEEGRMTQRDLRTTACNILMDQRLPRMTLASLAAWLYRLSMGHFELYGSLSTPRSLLALLQTSFPAIMSAESRYRADAEKWLAEQERQAWVPLTDAERARRAADVAALIAELGIPQPRRGCCN